MYLKKGDNVTVIAGKEKGKTGKIVRLLRENGKVVIEGLNTSKRRKRPTKEGQKGQVIEVPMPIHVSNVMLVGSDSKRTRIGYGEEKGVKTRISRRGGKAI